MPAFNWDPTRPAGNEPIASGDDLIRSDKDTLRKVLGTLTPSGTTDVGWRVVQIAHVVWITRNARYDGTNWVRDDTSQAAQAIRMNQDGTVDFLHVGSGTGNISWPATPTMQSSANGVFMGHVTPTQNNQVATKAYVDGAGGGGGLEWMGVLP